MMIPRLIAKHLRARLVLVAMMAITPAIIGIVLTQSVVRQRARERAIADHQRLARFAASEEATVIEGSARLLHTLAGFPAFLADDRRHCEDLLPSVMRSHPGYVNVMVVSADGQPFCSAVPLNPHEALDISQASWFARAVRERTVVVGDPMPGGRDTPPTVVVAYPIPDQSGRIARVIASTVGLSGLHAMAANTEVPAGASVTLFDRSRTILARIPDGSQWVGRRVPGAETMLRMQAGAADDVAETTGVDGARRVYVTVPVRASMDTGLYIGMGVDPRTVFHESDEIFRGFVWLLGFVFVSAIATAALAGHMFVIKPVRALRRVAERIAAGELSARADIADGIAGIGDLEAAVNHMAMALDARERARDHAEAELRDSEDRYRLLFARNPQPMWVFDATTLQFLEVNEAAVARYGYTREEFRAMTIRDIRPADEIPRLHEALSARAQFTHSGGWRHILKSGEVVDVEISSHPLNYGGKPAVVVTVQDITERNRAQVALLERIATTALTADVGMSLNRAHDLQPCLASCAEALIAHLDAAGACVWTMDETGFVLELQAATGVAANRSDRFARVLVGQTGIGRIARFRRAHFTNEAIGDREVDEQEWISAERLQTFVGCPLMVESRVVGVVAVYSSAALSEVAMTAIASTADLIALGIARHHAEGARRLLANIVANSDDAIIGATIDATIISWNAGAERLFGYTKDEVIGRSAAILRPDGDPRHFADQIDRMRRGERVSDNDAVRRRKDGSLVPVAITLSPIVDTANQLSGVSATIRDVSERIRAERALRDAEERMRFALEASQVGVWEANMRTGAAWWSETCEKMHGLAPGTFSRTYDAFIDRIDPLDRPDAILRLERAQREQTDARLEYRTTWPDGAVRWISCVGRFFYDAQGAPRRGAGIMVDVTERRSLEEQLRQAQKMEAIGQLAGGIAHDFNNLLTAILGFSSFVAESLDEHDRRRADVEEIKSAAERAAALTRQLLAFGRKQILDVHVLRLGDVVRDLTPMLRRLLGESVELTTTIGERDLVKADPGQLQQVLVNLAVNAKDAMPEGGRLTIETSDVRLDEAFAKRHPSATIGPHVLLSVTDTGHGMDADVQKRIFEPFFTTKPKGQGTGLGLATVYGIVKQSGGWIWVQSEPRRGTTFTVYLPTTGEVTKAPVQTAKERVKGGNETILLVEDEELVREWVCTVLSRRGYAVHAFGDPTKAISYAEQHPSRIDLVLSDVVLPEMSGKTMVAHVQERHPESRALFMSGYADHAIVQQGVLDPDTWFLQKPFSAEVVAGKVRQVIDAA